MPPHTNAARLMDLTKRIRKPLLVARTGSAENRNRLDRSPTSLRFHFGNQTDPRRPLEPVSRAFSERIQADTEAGNCPGGSCSLTAVEAIITYSADPANLPSEMIPRTRTNNY